MPSSLLATTLALSLGQVAAPVPPTEPAAPAPSEAAAPAATVPVEPPPVQGRLSFRVADDDVATGSSATLLHAALDARTPELASGLRAEAALSLFVTGGGQAVGFRDNASLLRLRFRPSRWSEGEGLALTAFPLSSTRLAMGYENRVTWARSVYPQSGTDSEPALELRLTRRRWSTFVALKSGNVLNDFIPDYERRFALFAGGSLDVTPAFHVDLSGALIDQGLLPPLALVGVQAAQKSRGLTARVLWHQGTPIGPSVDLGLAQGDPALYERFFLPESYPGGVSATVSLEGSFISQQLQDPDTVGGTRAQAASAAALGVRLKRDFLRVHALAYARTASFIQLDVPGLPPYKAFSQDAETRPELSATLGADYHLEGLGLTPGLLLRTTLPATYRGPSILGTPNAPPELVLTGPNQVTVLPSGKNRGPTLTAVATTRWDLGTVGGILAELYYARDPNRSVFVDGATGVAEPVPGDPHTVGFNLLLQARF